MSEAEYCFHSLHFVPGAEEINTHYEYFLANLANLLCKLLLHGENRQAEPQEKARKLRYTN